MKKWEYKIKNELGIHARPAAMLVREAKRYESRILLAVEGRTAPATDLMEIMELNAKCGQTVKGKERIGGVSALFLVFL